MIRNYISNAIHCEEFKGRWNPETRKCDIKDMKRTINESKNVDEALHRCNELLNGYGVEAVRGRDWISHYYQDINLLYVNKGDTYAPTIIYDTKKEIYYVGTSWGDIVESDMKRFEDY